MSAIPKYYIEYRPDLSIFFKLICQWSSRYVGDTLTQAEIISILYEDAEEEKLKNLNIEYKNCESTAFQKIYIIIIII